MQVAFYYSLKGGFTIICGITGRCTVYLSNSSCFPGSALYRGTYQAKLIDGLQVMNVQYDDNALTMDCELTYTGIRIRITWNYIVQDSCDTLKTYTDAYTDTVAPGVYTFAHTLIYTHAHVRTRKHIICIHTVCKQMCAYTQKHTHEHTHIHTHTHTAHACMHTH